MVQRSQFMNHADTLLLSEAHPLFRFPWSFPDVLAVVVLGCSIAFSYHASCPVSLKRDSFSDFPCFWWPCQFRGVLVEYFEGYPSICVCLMLPPDKFRWCIAGILPWKCCSPILEHHVQGPWWTYFSSLEILTLIICLQWGVLGFSTLKLVPL